MSTAVKDKWGMGIRLVHRISDNRNMHHYVMWILFGTNDLKWCSTGSHGSHARHIPTLVAGKPCSNKYDLDISWFTFSVGSWWTMMNRGFHLICLSDSYSWFSFLWGFGWSLRSSSRRASTGRRLGPLWLATADPTKEMNGNDHCTHNDKSYNHIELFT